MVPAQLLLLLPLLLLQFLSAAVATSPQDRLYDPYGLNQDEQPLPQPQPKYPHSAPPIAYRSYYLILVRNFSRVLADLHPLPSPSDPADVQRPLSLTVPAWTVDATDLLRLHSAVADGAQLSVEELQDANALLLGLFASLRSPVDGSLSNGEWRRSWPLDAADWLAPGFGILAGTAAAWLTLRRVGIGQLLLLGLMASVVFNWLRLYRLALAQRQHAILDLQCRQSDQPLGLWESLGMWLRSCTHVAPVKDECLRKMEALAVDPFCDVSPLEAAADLLSGVVLKRLVQLLQAFNLGYRSLIEGLPLWHSFIITGICIGLLVLFLLLRFGYGIRLFYGLMHLGPDPGGNLEDENRRLRRLLDAAGPPPPQPPPPPPQPELQRSASVAGVAPPAMVALEVGRGGVGGRGCGGADHPPASGLRRVRASRSESNISRTLD